MIGRLGEFIIIYENWSFVGPENKCDVYTTITKVLHTPNLPVKRHGCKARILKDLML